MTSTHELVERALRSHLRILSQCTPEQQPSEQLLYSLEQLLQLHRGGTPVKGVEERLNALSERVSRFETMVGIVNTRKR